MRALLDRTSQQKNGSSTYWAADQSALEQGDVMAVLMYLVMLAYYAVCKLMCCCQAMVSAECHT